MPLTDVDVTTLDPQRFRNLLSPEALAGFERAIERGRELLDERTMWNVNSTARGGGVAEMLQSLLGYVKGAGRRRALAGHRRRSRLLRRHEAAAQPPARP